MVVRKILWSSVFSFLFLLLFGWYTQTWADELNFTATVDQTTMRLDEELRLTVSVSGAGIRGVGEPKLPPLNDFEILGRSSSQSSQFTIVNGKISSTKTIDYVYTLRPRRTGSLVIGSAQVSFKGKKYQTEPIEIEVVRGELPEQRVQPGPPASVPDKSIFLTANADKTTAYLGEQITVDYSLYTAVNLGNVRLGNLPSYSGFWSEELFSAKRLNFSSKVVGGKRYDVAPIKRIALFPAAQGEFHLDPMSIICEVPVRTGDIFQDFWGRTRSVDVKSTPIQIKVNPLPAKGKPLDFSGGVGSFKFSVKPSSRTVRVGEPANITVTVSGRGNVRTLQVPRLPDLEGFKVYEPEMNLDISKSGSRISGTKTCKYMIVPNRQGKSVIPSLSFSFFNPKDERYHHITTDEIELDVRPGEVADVAGVGGLRGPVQILGRDIRYIKPDLQKLKRGRELLHQNRVFQAIQLLPAIALLLVFLNQRHRRRIEADVAYARLRRARSLASVTLKRANALLSKGELAPVPSLVAKAITDYAGDRMNLPTSGLTLDEILGRLRNKGAEEDVLRAFRICTEKCDLARFAGSGFDVSSAREIVQMALQVIEKLEKTKLK